MLQTLFTVLAMAIIAVLVIASTKPDTFSVKRSATIKAPPEKVFNLINDFHQWEWWSPWEKRDLNMKKTYSGATNGKGAIYEWDGNKDIGSGRMEILESVSSSKIKLSLDFFRPMKANNLTEFTLESKGDSTEVLWNMYGPAPFISKVMQVFMSMDKMVGKDFEAGLATLKSLAEK